ncbi:MAG: hypothetical protein QGG39_16800, partial [Candidatus Poribacteria bacterium]|nr:hypothetical protein [Candidatus Poribacteria bacterium]
WRELVVDGVGEIRIYLILSRNSEELQFATEPNTSFLDAMLPEWLTPKVTLVPALLILHLAPIWIFTYFSDTRRLQPCL